MNNYETCTNMYIIRTAKSMPCMYHVQTRIYNNECKYVIHTMFRPCIYTNIQVFVCMFVCIHVQTMYMPCTYMVCTISLCHEQEIQRKILQRAGYKPTIACITASCLNHYTTSMLASYYPFWSLISIQPYVHHRQRCSVITKPVYYHILLREEVRGHYSTKWNEAFNW
jgi:hypothetical protein